MSQKVLAARAERLKAQQAAGNLLPRAQLVNAQFDGASNSRALLARVSRLPAGDLRQRRARRPGRGAGRHHVDDQFASGGFDGHGQLANSYAQALPRLTNLVDYIWHKSADARHRQPHLHAHLLGVRPHAAQHGNGKDHWASAVRS